MIGPGVPAPHLRALDTGIATLTGVPTGQAWGARRRPTVLRTELLGALEVDVAIVGAGLVGISTALHLKLRAPTLRVLLLESDEVGAGASGRGTGLLGPRVGPEIEVLRRRYGDARAAAIYRASEAAVEEVVALVESQNISCGLHCTGQLLVARSEPEAKRLARRANSYGQLGLDVPWLGAQELRGLLGGNYRGALFHRKAASLDPALLTDELALRAEQLGVRICEHSPVHTLRPGSSPSLLLAKGVVRAKHVVLATNGYSTPMGARHGILPLEVQALATEPLASDVLAQLGWPGREAVLECGFLQPYLRLTTDDRIVLGGGSPQYPVEAREEDRRSHREQIARLQERWLRRIHPALSKVAIDRRWSGLIAVSRDGLPVVGPRRGERGLWYAGGWNGHGPAMSVRSGRELANALLADAPLVCSLPWWRVAAPALPRARLLRPRLDGGRRLLVLHHQAGITRSARVGSESPNT